MQMNRPRRNIHREKVSVGDWQTTIKRLWHYLANSRKYLMIVFLLTVITTVVTIVGTRINGIVIDRYISHHQLHTLLLVSASWPSSM